MPKQKCIHGISPKRACKECSSKYFHENYLKRREQHKIVSKAIQLSKHIPLGSKCEECGSTKQLEHHHEDYSKPLEVRTLCKSCQHKKKNYSQFKRQKQPIKPKLRESFIRAYRTVIRKLI